MGGGICSFFLQGFADWGLGFRVGGSDNQEYDAPGSI